MKWKLTWGDRSWTEDDLTVGHMVLICQGLGEDTWDFTPTAGPMKLLAVLAALIAVDQQTELVGVMALLGALPAVQLVEALGVEAAEEV